MTVTQTYCTMTYADEPTPAFIAQFTAWKAMSWAPIGQSIDAYIGDQVRAFINEAASSKRRYRKRNLPVHVAQLQALIDTEVNRGLAIIAQSPLVEVRSGPLRIIDSQAFESAIGALLSSQLGFSGKDLRKRRTQSRHWVDACAYELTQAYFGERIA